MIDKMADKQDKQEIKSFLEWFEYCISGKKNLNGGFAEVKIKSITRYKDYDNYYCVIADTTLGDYFDSDNPKMEHYPNCKYHLAKIKNKESVIRKLDGKKPIKWRLLTDKELEGLKLKCKKQ